MNIDKVQVEKNLCLHVDRLAGLIDPPTLQKPKTVQATLGYLEGQWHAMGLTVEREVYDAIGDEAPI